MRVKCLNEKCQSNQPVENALTRRQLLKYAGYSGLATGLSSCLWISGCAKKRKPKAKPNVVLIVLDTARADRFSFMGYHRKTSPYIDKLTSEGTVFNRAYATDFWTLPSHASLFTGLYPSQAGATSETNQLPIFNITLAETLKQAGYETAAFVCNPWVSKERGFGKGFDEFYEMWREENFSIVPKQYGTHEWATLKKVIPWLGKYKNVQKPFFLFVNFNCTHMPYQPPEPFISLFIRPGYNNERIRLMAQISGMWAHLAGKLELSERDFDILSDLYDGETAFADHCVGQIVNTMTEIDIQDNTVVVVTSDHGENLGEHGLIDHLLSMYETTLHVPLVIRYPAYFHAGTQISDFVSLVDIAPTILNICNVQEDVIKRMSSGISLVDNDRARREFIAAENERPVNGVELLKQQFPSFDTSTIDYRMRAVRTEKHKYIWRIGDGKELYDLNTDKAELKNLADKESDICQNLHQKLTAWMEAIATVSEVPLMKGQDAQSLEILRSLGYLK